MLIWIDNMIAEMIVWGFFSAVGWMGANWTVEKVFPEKQVKEEQVCSTWQEEKQSDGTVHRTRTCESTTKAAP
jgi:hypothetical protein